MVMLSIWEKVLKRLTLLNKHYPLRGKFVMKKIFNVYFNMVLKDIIVKTAKKSILKKIKSKKIKKQKSKMVKVTT